ncbi:MAG: hypothetical protein S0880_18245 [Actinomycetota bacterium]|nr:hypothetical protein [Actinomycetota bacterium]
MSAPTAWEATLDALDEQLRRQEAFVEGRGGLPETAPIALPDTPPTPLERMRAQALLSRMQEVNQAATAMRDRSRARVRRRG